MQTLYTGVLYPPHQQGVPQEEQYGFRDGYRGEGCQVRQPGDDGEDDAHARGRVVAFLLCPDRRISTAGVSSVELPSG